jgi:hypothetical protein
MSAPTPVLIPQPFANDAGPSFINTIPDTTGDPELASYQIGFPPLTFQPVGSGGVPPQGQDFNGILNAITTHLFALQAGQLRTYDTDVRDAVAGYALGAVLAMANGNGYWISTTADNVTNPDTGGAGWEPVYAYGPTASVVAGGVLTLSAVEAARPYLIFTGTLSGNQQVVVPNSYRNWLVINGCTMNGFTLTVKTAAGTGVAIPAGGTASPTAIYCDSANVNYQFVPSALPTSVTPVADTIVLRDNLGASFTTTAVPGTTNTTVASTQFVNPGTLLAANGYRKNPDGTIDQWGYHVFNNNPVTVNFPTAFAVACWNVQLTPQINSVSLRDKCPVVGATNINSFTMQDADGSNGTFWRAMGR